ncbi:ribonuclease H-like domain-containing protein [Russula compacta]|nr:ribonuclease H-like domain-containing protein [Russula compacta]
MSGTSSQGSPPRLHKSASTSKVLSALDTSSTGFPTINFRPNEHGIIDLTTPEDDALSNAVRALVIGRRPSSASSAPALGGIENRRLNKSESFKENEGTIEQDQSFAGKDVKIPSTLASRSAATNCQSPDAVTKPPPRPPVPSYPLYDYADNIPKPKVIYIKNEELANEMVASLNGAIGLDLEWPYTSNRIDGVKEGKVALVQLCDVDIILLIHVSKMERFPEKVKELIESSKVPKTGVNIRNDGMKLFRDYGILASNLVELGALACQADERFATTFNRPIVALAKVVSYCLHKTLDKGPVRVSDWSRDLTRAQMKYASNDVHSGLMVYKSLMKAARSSRTRLVPERYIADLAEELIGRGDGELVNRTGHDGSVPTPSSGGDEPPHRQAYTLWRQGHGLLDICIRMRDRANPESETVVITNILRALAEDPTLPFSVEALISLVRLDSTSWVYHRHTIERWAQEGRGLDGA